MFSFGIGIQKGEDEASYGKCLRVVHYFCGSPKGNKWILVTHGIFIYHISVFSLLFNSASRASVFNSVFILFI